MGNVRNYGLSRERLEDMIKAHERVVLTSDFLEYRHDRVWLPRRGGVRSRVFTLEGQTLAAITVEAEQVRPVSQTEVMHARRVT